MLIPPAWAQTAGGNSTLVSFLPLILIFLVFYFLLIRPQQKRARTHREMVTSLNRGDRVVTTGGLVGSVARLPEDGREFILDLGNGVQVRHLRHLVQEVTPRTRAAERTPAPEKDRAPAPEKDRAPAPKKDRAPAPEKDRAPAAEKDTEFDQSQGRGTASKYHRARIYRNVQENPRRVDSHGHRSFGVIYDGMTYDEYIADGGRPKDLQWDIDKGYIRLEFPDNPEKNRAPAAEKDSTPAAEQDKG